MTPTEVNAYYNAPNNYIGEFLSFSLTVIKKFLLYLH